MGREGFLQGVELPVRLKALDGFDLAPVGLDAEDEAGPDRETVEQNGARTADAVLASQVRSCVTEIMTQHIGKGPSRFDLDFMSVAIDGDPHEVDIFHEDSPSYACDSLMAVRRRSGVMGSRSISMSRCDRASATALAIAAGAPMVPPSPIPLAPVSVYSQGVSKCRISTVGISIAVGTR